MSFEIKYQLMTTEQVEPSVMAEWLEDRLFRKYVEKQRNKRN